MRPHVRRGRRRGWCVVLVARPAEPPAPPTPHALQSARSSVVAPRSPPLDASRHHEPCTTEASAATHVIIDHIFGVVTVGLRRKEKMLPDDLVQSINASLAANPQYMAKPVEFLHCLWDFKKWCHDQMKPVSIDRLFKGNVQDEYGTYNGMYDLLFTHGSASQGSRTLKAVMKYREHVTHPWLPEASHGVLVITAMPVSVPEFQQLKPYSMWAMDGSKNVRDTILICVSTLRARFKRAHSTSS